MRDEYDIKNLNPRKNPYAKNYPSIHDIGKQFKTPLGIGTLVEVDAGAAFYVNIDGEIEQFEMKDLEFVNTPLLKLSPRA